MSEIYIYKYLDNLTSKQKLFLFDIFTFKVKKITWDFDQILFDTETPVKQAFYIRTKIDYRQRKIDRWLALSTWAKEDGKKVLEDLETAEKDIWKDPLVLKRAKPIRAMQLYSKMAFLKGVEQSVVTSRESELSTVTLDGIKKHYDWICEKDVHIRNDNNVPRDEYKGLTVGEIMPDVHFEDSIDSTSAVLKHSKANVMLFPRLKERNMFIGDERVVELPDMSMILSLLR